MRVEHVAVCLAHQHQRVVAIPFRIELIDPLFHRAPDELGRMGEEFGQLLRVGGDGGLRPGKLAEQLKKGRGVMGVDLCIGLLVGGVGIESRRRDYACAF